MEEFILFRGQKLYYYVYGKGSHALLAFHGFGQSGKNFGVFEDMLGQHLPFTASTFFTTGKVPTTGRLFPKVI